MIQRRLNYGATHIQQQTACSRITVYVQGSASTDEFHRCHDAWRRGWDGTSGDEVVPAGSYSEDVTVCDHQRRQLLLLVCNGIINGPKAELCSVCPSVYRSYTHSVSYCRYLQTFAYIRQFAWPTRSPWSTRSRSSM